MEQFTMRRTLGTALVLGAMTVAANTVNAQGKILRADTDAQGASGHTMVIVASKIWKRELGLSV